MKVRFYHWYNAVLAALLALMGFESCGGADEYGTPVVEYGMPNVSFQVKGNVTNEEDKPIEGIKVGVNMRYEYNDAQGNHHVEYQDYFNNNTAITDSEGNFQTPSRTTGGIDNPDLKLIIEDVDGEANGGEFQSDTLDLKDLPRQQIQNGDGRWYNGGYELTANIKLKKK